MSSLPAVRIRFCGGCNPEIDRRETVDLVTGRLKGLAVWTFDREAPADAVLHVSGCAHACLDEQDCGEKSPPVVSIQGLRIDRQPVSPDDLPRAAAEKLLRLLDLLNS